jgi:hypothetical protein
MANRVVIQGPQNWAQAGHSGLAGVDGHNLDKQKARAQAGFFCFLYLSSEYQTWSDLLPNPGSDFGGEVVLYQRL